jgi:hypothetical protein
VKCTREFYSLITRHGAWLLISTWLFP